MKFFRLNLVSEYLKMAYQNHSVEDIAKVYDTFFREHFKNNPNFADIQAEYQSFRNELVKYANEMTDDDFKTYTSRKKAVLKSKIQELSMPSIPASISQADPARLNHQSKKNFFFDFLRGVSAESNQVDAYLSSFRCHQARELLKDGDIPNFQEFSKVHESKVCSGVKKTADSDVEKEFSPKVVNSIRGYLKLDDKSYYRIMNLANFEKSPLGLIFISYFIAAFERNMTSLAQAINYLTDLYNLVHHLSLKTEYFMLFSNLSKYFQQMMLDITTRKFESEGSILTYASQLLLCTLHDEKVSRGLKLLCASMISLVVEFADLPTLAKICNLQGEDIREQRAALTDLVQGVMLKDRVTADNFLVYMPKVVKLMNALGFCLATPVQCYLLLVDGSVWCIQSLGTGAGDPAYMMASPQDFKSIFAYEEAKKALVDRLQPSDAMYGLDDFLSLSDKEPEVDIYTPESKTS